MEPINVHISIIEDLLAKLEDVIEASRPVPFSSKVSVDKEAIYDVIDEIRPIIDDIHRDLPSEIIQAKRVLSDSDKIINDARNKAKSIISAAETEMEKMISEHSISQQAMEQATQLIEDAKKSARELRINAMEYADEILARTETMVREAMTDFVRNSRETEEFFSHTIDTIYENRQELRPKQ